MPEHSPLEDFLAGVGQRFKNAQAGHSKRLKGRSLQEIFESGPGAGFGAGTVGSVRGLAPGLGITLGGRQVTKGGLGQIDKTAITSKKSNLNRSASISEEGFRRNVGGKRPPDAELEALALRKQVTAKANKSALKSRTRIFEITKKLDQLKRQGLSAKTSREAIGLQKELRALTENLTGKPIGGKKPPKVGLEELALEKQQATRQKGISKERERGFLRSRTKALEEDPGKFKRRLGIEKRIDDALATGEEEAAKKVGIIRNKVARIETRISEVDNELNGLKRRGFDAKTSTKVVSLQKELRSLINRAEDLKE